MAAQRAFVHVDEGADLQHRVADLLKVLVARGKVLLQFFESLLEDVLLIFVLLLEVALVVLKLLKSIFVEVLVFFQLCGLLCLLCQLIF